LPTFSVSMSEILGLLETVCKSLSTKDRPTRKN